MTSPHPTRRRLRQKVQFSLSDEARAVLAEVPNGMRSQWVDEAIREKRERER